MKKLSSLLLLILLISSCSQDLIDDTTVKEKGKETIAHFSFTTAPLRQVDCGEAGVITRTVTGTIDDQLINDMWVVQFDNTGAFMKKEFSSNQDFTKFDAPLSANYGTTKSTVYFIANIGGTMDVPVDEAAFKTQMKTFKNDSELASTDPVSGKRSIPMFGKVTELAVPASGVMETAVNVTLKRMVAQVDITYDIPNGVEFNLEGVRLCNVPVGVQFVEPATPTTITNFTVNTLQGDALTGSSTPKTVTLYLPENQRGTGSNSTGTEERFKDGAGTTNSTYVEFYGHKTGKLGGDKVYYRIYVGEDNLNNYNIVRNTKYKITATLGGVSASDRRVVVQERANCYIVAPNGSVEIPITRANESELGVQIPDVTAAGAWTPSVYWQTAATLITVDATTATKGYFKVNAGATEGNAVVIAKKADGTIVWSWHIWVEGDDLNTGNQTLGSLTMMDRNLGATTNVSGASYQIASPLMYQWGRKDPFLGTIATAAPYTVYTAYNGAGTAFVPPAYTGITTVAATGDPYFLYANINQSAIGYGEALSVSIHNPALYLMNWRGSTYKVVGNVMSGCDSWGGEFNQPKSLYDPCPAGWRVPTCKKTSTTVSVPWPTASYTAVATPVADGRYAVLYNNYGVFPASGYRGGTDTSPFASVGGYAMVWSATNGNFDNGGSTAHDLYMSTATDFSELDRTGRQAGQPIRCVKNWFNQ